MVGSWALILGACLAGAQQTREGALYQKCDSQIPWISDGIELRDNLVGGRPPEEPAVDRNALLERAKSLAAERNRLILWYCFRLPGSHMYRGRLLDRYMRASVFTDPAVTDLVRSKFVPLRMACEADLGSALGIRTFDFVEPGFVLLTPEGRVVHTISRLRTFNPLWIRSALAGVLRKNPAFNAPAGESAEDLLCGGDDEEALRKTEPARMSLILRLLGRPEEALKVDGPALQKGLALLELGRLEESRAILEKESSPEALYHLSAIDRWTGRDPAPRWKALVEGHPDSPWSWRAAANLVRGPDTRPDGPLANLFEDLQYRPAEGPPRGTTLPASDADSAVRRAVEFLLRAQGPDGSWNDARYAYWPDPRIQPNTWMAVTALAALALSEWAEIDPPRIRAALARAEAHLEDDRRMNRGQNEECYADAYRLLYWASKKDAARMNRLVARLAAQQDKQGFWAHEYPNPFATAGVVHCLAEARKAGASVPDPLFQKAADALLKTRGSGGRQAYLFPRPPSPEKDSAGRTALCELALVECGRGSPEDVAAGLEVYWRHYGRLEAVRVCDFHSDGELAGFFFYYDLFHAAEAARALGEPGRGEHLRRLRERVLALPEIDGSFVDSHELGKSYGTAMALLVLSRTR